MHITAIFQVNEPGFVRFSFKILNKWWRFQGDGDEQRVNGRDVYCSRWKTQLKLTSGRLLLIFHARKCRQSHSVWRVQNATATNTEMHN